VKTSDAQVYLFEYLKEEFKRYPSVRIRILPFSEGEGVNVKTEAREYFFETSWVEQKRFDVIDALILRVQEVL
jgi:hypothetical protein